MFGGLLNKQTYRSEVILLPYGVTHRESVYSYDANGNLTGDSGKQIGASYNYLNLPTRIEK